MNEKGHIMNKALKISRDLRLLILKVSFLSAAILGLLQAEVSAYKWSVTNSSKDNRFPEDKITLALALDQN